MDVGEPQGPEQRIRTWLDRELRDLLHVPENLRVVVQLATGRLAAQLDFSRMELVRETFLTGDMRERATDLLVRIPWVGDTQAGALVYLLLEHQSSKDPLIALRLLVSIAQVCDWQRRERVREGVPESKVRLSPVIPIVFYTGDRPWDHIATLRELTDCDAGTSGFVPEFDMAFMNLCAISEEELLAADRCFGGALELLRRRYALSSEVLELLRRLRADMMDLLSRDPQRFKRLVLFILRVTLFCQEEEEQGPVRREVESWIEDVGLRKEVEQMATSYAEKLLQDGWTKGKAEGKAEGKAHTLVRQLTRKFGPVPQATVERLSELRDEALLDTLLDRILQANRIEEMGLENIAS